MEKYIGAHVSIAGGIENGPLNATDLNATAFAMFTKNQRQWNSPPLKETSIKLFKENLRKSKIKAEHVLPHDGYLINLGNADIEKREKSLNSFIDEINRVEQLGLHLLNFHPGSHLKVITEDECIDLIAESINIAIDKTKNATLVIENMAGQGSNMGYDFMHLKKIIDRISNKERIGVCIDTCHLLASGYDITTPKKFDKVMNDFEKIVGVKYLRGVHLNDSKFPAGSRKDRHESIGKGEIGLASFKWMMKDSRFNNIPLTLETPNSNIWEEEIKLLKSFC